VPDIAIELVSVEKGKPLKPGGSEVCGEDFAVNNKLGAMSLVIDSLAKICLGEFDLAEGPHTIGRSPPDVYVGLFVRYCNGLWFPLSEDSFLTKGPGARRRPTPDRQRSKGRTD
jgi:hypothetical protein